MTGAGRSDEAAAAYRRYVEARGAAQRGEAPWSTLAEFFTEDAVFVDPAWGRSQGRAEIARFMDDSMAGLEGWTFPEEWTIVDGDRVVAMWWNRLPGSAPDGRPLQAPGVSVLRYAGDGLFDYELDILNMAEIFEVITQSDWAPSGGMKPPPERPDRDPSPPQR